MKILLLGNKGQLGTTLQPELRRFGEVFGYDRDEIDIEDLDGLRRLILELEPGLLINAAAYTAVDMAESEPERAARVNGVAPAVMAASAREVGAVMIHYSTDYVFDGTSMVPYTEADPPNPKSVYGRTKLDGEIAVQASGADALILRTAWVYSRHGHNFLNTMLRLARDRDEIRVVGDQIGSPTTTNALSDGTLQLVEYAFEHGGFDEDQRGVYHMTCSGETSWCDFAREIMRLSGNQRTRITEITTDEYPTPARRPAYSVLANDKLEESFGIRLPDWRDALERLFPAD